MYQYIHTSSTYFFRLGLNNMKNIEFSFISENLQISLYVSAFLSHFFFLLFLIFINRFSLPKVSDKNSSKKCIIMVVRQSTEPSLPWSLKMTIFITTKDEEERSKDRLHCSVTALLTIVSCLLSLQT